MTTTNCDRFSHLHRVHVKNKQYILFIFKGLIITFLFMLSLIRPRLRKSNIRMSTHITAFPNTESKYLGKKLSRHVVNVVAITSSPLFSFNQLGRHIYTLD